MFVVVTVMRVVHVPVMEKIDMPVMFDFCMAAFLAMNVIVMIVNVM